jgi:hypothetical protein
MEDMNINLSLRPSGFTRGAYLAVAVTALLVVSVSVYLYGRGGDFSISLLQSPAQNESPSYVELIDDGKSVSADDFYVNVVGDKLDYFVSRDTLDGIPVDKSASRIMVFYGEKVFVKDFSSGIPGGKISFDTSSDSDGGVNVKLGLLDITDYDEVSSLINEIKFVGLLDNGQGKMLKVVFPVDGDKSIKPFKYSDDIKKISVVFSMKNTEVKQLDYSTADGIVNKKIALSNVKAIAKDIYPIGYIKDNYIDGRETDDSIFSNYFVKISDPERLLPDGENCRVSVYLGKKKVFHLNQSSNHMQLKDGLINFFSLANTDLDVYVVGNSGSLYRHKIKSSLGGVVELKSLDFIKINADDYAAATGEYVTVVKVANLNDTAFSLDSVLRLIDFDAEKFFILKMSKNFAPLTKSRVADSFVFFADEKIKGEQPVINIGKNYYSMPVELADGGIIKADFSKKKVINRSTIDTDFNRKDISVSLAGCIGSDESLVSFFNTDAMGQRLSAPLVIPCGQTSLVEFTSLDTRLYAMIYYAGSYYRVDDLSTSLPVVMDITSAKKISKDDFLASAFGTIKTVKVVGKLPVAKDGFIPVVDGVRTSKALVVGANLDIYFPHSSGVSAVYYESEGSYRKANLSMADNTWSVDFSKTGLVSRDEYLSVLNIINSK